MKNKFTYIGLWIALLLISACNQKVQEVDIPIVTVGNQTLTLNNLIKGIPDNLHDADSVSIVEDFINRWIKTQLTLNQAELNLSSDEKNVEQQLQDYRTSLLVYMYQQKMLEQKHSPLVREQEIEKYYNEMHDNFKLQENVVKGVFIKIPRNIPNQYQVRQWCRSRKQEDLVNIENYCAQHSLQYEIFLEDWTPFKRINNLLPNPISNEERFLPWNKNYETRDSTYNYFIGIEEFTLIGSTAPLSYVESRIKAILLNKKRMEFINKLEQDLFDEALRNKIIKFH